MGAGDFASGAPALVVGPSDQAPGRARRFLVERFRELGLGDDYVGRLVVTELVTNAYKHVGFGRIVVRVAPERQVRVAVGVCSRGDTWCYHLVGNGCESHLGDARRVAERDDALLRGRMFPAACEERAGRREGLGQGRTKG
ncbi:hypothetical protein [Actinomadura sp. NPDC048394]|jgi:hypothetical protein|uniref:hypothetical protein n=1 Tax=Actinomadura sp. NPDC048394 TaxID=3158223 RepID=UPI00340F0EAD